MRKLTLVVLVVVVVAVVGGWVWKNWLGPGGEKVTIIHWSNAHLTRPGLLNEMAKQFNSENQRTKSGHRIEVKVVSRDSVVQVDDLLSRITHDSPLDPDIENPTIVTPQSAEWLNRVTQGAGRLVVDPATSQSIARAYVGIVTYRQMAETLGWPNKDIGYADLITLRSNPEGWASIPGAQAEWGPKPLLSFTDPTTSSTGRSVLFSLYAIAAGKPVEKLTPTDVNDPKVVSFVKDFQKMIDHYMPGTIPQNTKVYQGPHYGQFFLMPEDDLVHLYEGGESAFVNGIQVKAPPINQPMVMLYPKEGSMVFNNIAGIVKAPWVTDEQTEAANKWSDFLLQDERQRAFLASGFRPGGNLSLNDPASKITGKYGLNATPRTPLLTPERIDPAVTALIEQSWQDVKKPAIVTFAVDVSASMSGPKLDQAKTGMVRALDNMARNNQVGFLTFSDTIGNRVAVAPLEQNKFTIAGTVQQMKVQTNTALYDGIKTAIEMTDMAPGQADTIRAVVVLTDGRANRGTTRLDNLINMISRSEAAIKQFRGFEGDAAWEESGAQVQKQDIVGAGLAIATRNPIQIFFIGIGEDADMEVGRMLAQATGAEFQGVTDKDLAKLLEGFSKYF